ESLGAYEQVSPRTTEVRSGVIPALEAPATPTDLTVLHVTPAGVALSWSPVTNGHEYVVERAGTDAVFTQVAVVETTAYTDADADTAQAWSYRVSARNQVGSSDPTAPVTSPVYVAPPALPEGDVVAFDFGPGALAEGALLVTS